MKLLLTSKGVTNNSIKKALEELLDQPISESIVAFIPTACHGTFGNKSWFVDELNSAHGLGWKEFRVLEITALDSQQISEQMTDVDVVFVNGGNPYYLMHKIVETGFEDILIEATKSKIYVSSSAGGIITSKYFPGDLAQVYGEQDRLGVGAINHSLGLVDFVVKPHMNSLDFPNRTIDWYESISSKINAQLYAIDDQTAIKVVDGDIEVISEGQWKLFN